MEKEYIVIWPSYINSSLSRNEGRKVSKKIAVESPSIEEILNACKELGLDVLIEKNKAFPRTPWDKSGRVLVKKSDKKLKLLIKICEIIRKNRKHRP
ncbi:MAG: signal recognition particle subunit SRP19/SEC65 family protein [Candidatus Methanomethylicaceae archaeon]|nr:signal recognition particle subunit SRP19/SEC65 family protein [Candidatus Verstraetearchaeota archaeon]